MEKSPFSLQSFENFETENIFIGHQSNGGYLGGHRFRIYKFSLADLSRSLFLAGILIGATFLFIFWQGYENNFLIDQSWALMVPTVALSFVLAGISLFSLTYKTSDVGRIASYFVAAVMLGVSLVNVGSKYLDVSWNSSVDRMIATTFSNMQLGNLSALQMNSYCWFNLMFLSLAILLIEAESRILKRIQGIFLTVGLLLAALVMLGYLYNIERLYNLAHEGPIALVTAFTFFLFYLGVVFLNPKQGFARLFFSRTVAGAGSRKLLPQVVLVPILITGLVLWGFRRDYFDASVGFSLLALVNLFLLTMIVVRSARSLQIMEEQKKIGERERQELELRLSRIVANAPLIIYSLDRDGIVTSAQGKGLEPLGLRPDQVINKHILNLYPDEPEVKSGLARAIAGEAFRMSVQVGNRTFEVQHVPSRLIDGKLEDSVGMAFDITQARLAEDNLLKANAELHKMTQVAEEASLAKSQFVASMSHEIRTPLHTILGIADLLGETPLNEEQVRYVSVYKKSSQHLLELINNTLDLLQIEAGEMTLECRTFCFRQLIEGVADWASLTAQMKNIKFNLKFDSNIQTFVDGDARRIRQILFNVLANSTKFTEQGEVSLEAKLLSTDKLIQTVEILINDTGIGIEREKQESVFEEFNQADRSITRRYGGSGLGLAITKKLVSEMGGLIEVKSEVSQGTQFKIILPLRMSQGKMLKEDPSAHVDNADSPVANILVAEDLEDNQFLLKSYFKGGTFKIDWVENGKMALEKVKNNNYDLVLMDMHMPVMDGYTAIREIRSWEKTLGKLEMPIIALTAHALVDEVDAVKKVGCSVYLTKPIRKSVLLGEINKQLQKIKELA